MHYRDRLHTKCSLNLCLKGNGGHPPWLFSPWGCFCSFSRCSQNEYFGSNCLFQLVNNGPSVVSHSTLEVRCPLRTLGHELLYPMEVVAEGPLSCSSKHTFNALKLKVRQHTHRRTLLAWWGHYLSLFLDLNIWLCLQMTVSMCLCVQLQPPAAEGLTLLKSSTEHHIRRRELYRDLLAEQGNLVRQCGKEVQL